MITIRPLTPDAAAQFQTLRLRGLRDHPEAFGSAYEDELATPLERVAERLIASAERFTLGAWQDAELVGMAGFFRNSGRKTRHRGGVWGMYVAPEARGHGIGAALLREIIGRARVLDGLEEIVLAVTVGNPTARAIYTTAGFVSSHVEPRYIKIDGQYWDIEWMCLRFAQ